MKLYSDSSLSNEIKEISFGEVKIGSSQMLTVYLHNNSKATLRNVKYRSSLGEGVIQLIAPGESRPITLLWKPELTLREGLKTSLEIEGEEVYK